MTTQTEALKLARTALGVQLDALLGKAGHLRNDDRRRYAENGIKAIDEALAQPEQEPVAYRYKYPDGFWRFSNGERVNGSDSIKSQALYTTPPQRTWVGLTEEEIFSCENSVPDEAVTDRDWCIHFAQAIEAKLKEKNT